MAAISLNEYANALKRSGLLSADAVKQQYKSFRDGVAEGSALLADAEAFAAFLQSEDLLTQWQNASLLAGKYRGLVFGKFKMQRLLGIGGMGRVFLAEDQMLRRQVALKVLPKQAGQNASLLQRFHHEAQALARLDHPNIVRVHDVDSRDDTHYIVMEYVQGIDLRDKVDEEGPLDDAMAAEFIRQVAVGLSHAHANDLIHRDIKPANLLLDDDGTVKIVDLGLALLQSDEDGSITADPTKAIGTADYIAPEQALNSHDIDQRTDIYSLGCTLYFLLTGQPPFADGTNAHRLMAHQISIATPINEVRSELGLPAASDALIAICTRMMAKKPDDRFRDCDELRDAIESLASDGRLADSSSLVEDSELCLPEATLPEASLPTSNHRTAKKVKVKSRILGSKAGVASGDTDSQGASVTVTDDDATRIVRRDAPTKKVKSPKSARKKANRKKPKKPIALIALCVGLLLAIGGVAYMFAAKNAGSASARPRQSSASVVQGKYYAVGDSTRYHNHDCRHVIGKSNLHELTSDQIASGEYQACGTCKPD